MRRFALTVLLPALLLAGPVAANQTDQQIADYCRNIHSDDLGARRACLDEQRLAARAVLAWAAETRDNQDARLLHGACSRATQLNNGGYHWPDQHACIDAEVRALAKLDEERGRAKTDAFTAKIIQLCGSRMDTRATNAYRLLAQCLLLQRKAGEKVSEMYQFFQPQSPERDIINSCAQKLQGADGTYDWPKVKACADSELSASAVLQRKKK